MDLLFSNWTSKANFKKYLYESRWFLLIGSAVLLLIYLSQLLTMNIRIDTQIFINEPNTTYNWLQIGRQGGVLSRFLFEGLNFNPYYNYILSYIFYIFAMCFFGYLFNCIGNVNAALSVVSFLVFLTHPVWAEQAYFSMQVLPISFAVLILPVSVLLSFYGVLKRNLPFCIISTILSIWIFSTYQIFIILYIAAVIFCSLLLYTRSVENINTRYTFKDYFKLILGLVLIFIIAIAVNAIITKSFFNSSSYLASGIRWNTSSIKQCAFTILKSIKTVVTGEGVFYSYGYLVSIVLVLLITIYNLSNYDSKCKWLYILLLMALWICPFVLTIILGNLAPARTHIDLAFVISCNILLIIIFALKMNKTLIRIGAFLLSLWIICSQAQVLIRLFYTDDIRYQNDLALARAIEQRLFDIPNYYKKPIAFIGKPNDSINASCVQGDLIGVSLFTHDGPVKPYYLHSTAHIISLYHNLGVPLIQACENEIWQARIIAKTMPQWPEEGCIFDNGSFIVVKLGNDDYISDMMNSAIEKREFTPSFQNELLQHYVDNIQIIDGDLQISGWLFRKNDSCENSQVNVYLYNENEKQAYKIYADRRNRPDVHAAFLNEADYNLSGFSVSIPLMQIQDDLSNYKLILSYEKDGETLLCDTNKLL